MNPGDAGTAAGVRVMIRWQRIAFTGSAVLAALTVTGAELGASGAVLALPGFTALMSGLVGGFLWVCATMISFDPPGDDEAPGDGRGGSKTPDGPSSPPGSDWDQFEAELRDWAREREPTPA